ncbi:hypothetical protein ACN38_g12519 [Penicillium nordicum]|uniref:Uncharacterized protein n=1 Tax=Penicillium nordicum TaxID=229535 RepID=A0A0M9WA58_9EURO|nr:hypothetical protein ACN38_g12519 [Penicillium nordicum]
MHTKLVSTSESSFTKADLEQFGISVDNFNPTDPKFLNNRKKCLFKPFGKEDIKRFELPGSGEIEDEGANERLDIQDVPSYSHLARNPTEDEITQATRDVIGYLQTNLTFRYEGRTRATRRLLSDELGWTEVECEEFTGGYPGLLFSTPGRYIGKEFAGWWFQSLQEWWTKDSWDADVLAGPSIQIIIATDGIGRGDRILMLSFFGPRHGRILQACYDSRSQKLELRISPIFSFLEKDDDSFDLFLRFMASSPPEAMNLDLSKLSLQSR